jgi:succinate-semialdehyde dehydrogenase/glutarate-semialdehyde dehydrogenase
MSHTYDVDLTMVIDGERLGAAGRSTHRVVNPATGQTLGDLPLATPQDLDHALATAARGYRLWRARSAAERGNVLAGAARLLRERIERIARIATLEEGKTLPEAKGEVMMAAALFDFYAGEVHRIYGRVLVRPAGTLSRVIR